MRNYILYVITSIIVSFIVTLSILNLPTSWFNLSHKSTLVGSTFTQLSGINTLSAFPTTYNSNLAITANTSAPNSFIGGDTFQGTETYQGGFVAQASSTVNGNLTSSGIGTFNSLTLSNPVTIQNGGTSSTTLSQYQVLLGNGTSGITTLNGFGTNGQFLTSGGTNVLPTWTSAAINQSLGYVWTGAHAWTSTADFETLEASSSSAKPMFLNGLSFWISPNRAASSTALEENGSGALTFQILQPSMLSQANNLNLSTSNTSTTTLYGITIPANTLVTNSFARIIVYWNANNNGQSCNNSIGLGNGTATTTIGYLPSRTGVSTLTTNIDAMTSILTEDSSFGNSTQVANGSSNPTQWQYSTSTTYNLASQLYLEFDTGEPGGGTTCSLLAYTFEIL